MFFLVIALSQFIPYLQVGLMFTYIAPLVMVLLVTIAKELYDDLQRKSRDRDLNETIYNKL
jgi:phospholipid-translocating ATPase